jgi:DNA-binding LacI/PurR family transcriptional regulator
MAIQKNGTRTGATLGQIAEAAGVSRATVSRALNDNPMISEPVRKKVRRLAKRLGYRPDPEVARLLGYLKRSRKGRLESIVAVLNGYRPPEKMQAEAYTLRMLSGARERAEALGYKLDELPLYSDGMTPRRFDQIVRARGIKGLLVPPEPEPLFQAGIDWSAVAAVATTTTAHPLDLHRVLPHNFANMRMLFEEALARGYKRIGLVYWPVLEERQMNAATSVYAWHAHVARRVPALPMLEWNWKRGEQWFDAAELDARLRDWVRRARPDLVLGFADYVRKRLTAACGLRVPEDVGYLSYGETTAGAAHLDQNPEAVGAAALDLLSAQIHRGEAGIPTTPKTILVAGRLLEGKTLRRAEGAE